jgi:hypothetical protein
MTELGQLPTPDRLIDHFRLRGKAIQHLTKHFP